MHHVPPPVSPNMSLVILVDLTVPLIPLTLHNFGSNLSLVSGFHLSPRAELYIFLIPSLAPGLYFLGTYHDFSAGLMFSI